MDEQQIDELRKARAEIARLRFALELASWLAGTLSGSWVHTMDVINGALMRPHPADDGVQLPTDTK